jgi:hypothetical protein
MRGYETAGTALLVVLAAALVGVLAVAVSAEGVGEPDFLVYWSAARLLASGNNPYDPVALQSLQKRTRPERGQEYGRAFASWNPPWLLVALLPFGLLPFDSAVPAWMLCNVALIAAASVLTWRMVARSSDKRGILLVVTVCLWSGPALSAIVLGQVSSLGLVGLVLGARWLHSGRDRLAGAALLLATIKPHVVYLVLFVFMLWVIRHRRWQVVCGMIAAVAISMAILWARFPPWASAYFDLLTEHRSMLFKYATSTIGGLAYALWGTHAFRFAGLLLLPSAAYLARIADSLGWLTAMNVALLVSVPLALYGFNADQVVLLPAILQIISWLWRRELSARWAWVIGGGLTVVCVASLAMLAVSYRYCYWFALLPLALAGLYAVACKQRTPTPAVTRVSAAKAG